ncbi:hypothetical protein AgCh_038837 [Apium graveolens]
MRLVVEMVLNGKIQENRNYNDGGTSNGYSTSSGHQHVSRAPVIAPPGFSGSTRAPPPCYTSVERMEQAFDINSDQTSAPNAKGRLEILKVHAQKVKLSKYVDLSTDAQNLPVTSTPDPGVEAVTVGIRATVEGSDGVTLASIKCFDRIASTWDFRPGCGPSSSMMRPPVPPVAPSGTSSPIPYHVHRAVNTSFIRDQSPEFAAQLDQVPIAPFQGISAPSPEVRARVRALTQMAVERARSVDHFISFEFRAVQYQDLVNLLVFELGSIGGSDYNHSLRTDPIIMGDENTEMPPKRNSQPNNGSAGDPSMSDLMNLLRQQTVQLAQQQQQFQQQQQQLQQQQQQQQ